MTVSPRTTSDQADPAGDVAGQGDSAGQGNSAGQPGLAGQGDVAGNTGGSGAKAGRAAGRGRKPISGTVLRTQPLSSTMIRVVVGGPELALFSANQYADAYLKLVFLRPGVQYPRPLDLEAIRQQFDPKDWPQQRTYTVRAWDHEALELTIDFVVHGDEGLAGPWARTAAAGDELLFTGPGGGYAPQPEADWHLLIGDESALPAIAATLERLPATAVGHVLLEVDGVAQEQSLAAPEGVRVRWVHRGAGRFGSALVGALSALPFPDGEVQAFVHGEAGVVKELRRVLKLERGLAQSQLSISGYWRLGVSDEVWRSVKADWNREIEQDEQAEIEGAVS
jgi:NADPH-dependent ferric siderophore reductase